MEEKLQSVLDELKLRFGGEMSEYQGDARIVVSREHILEVCRTLHDEFDFELLSDITAVDYWPQMEPRFHVVYQIRSIQKNLILTIRVPIPDSDPTMSTVEKVYRGANWYEREIYDMFGITFDGHSDLRRILMPHDWEGHPLRKDYPLGYEEVQFTFNYDEIDQRKPYAKE